jgi:hypothetical protein
VLLASRKRMWRIRSSSGREIPVEEGRDGAAGNVA